MRYAEWTGCLNFSERFRTDAECHAYLASRRWPEGFVCPLCGGRAHSFISTQKPPKIWFFLIYLLANQKTGVSVLWDLLHAGHLLPAGLIHQVCGMRLWPGT